MHKGLIRVLRPDKRGTPRYKWVRPEGSIPPSQENSHRRKYVTELRIEILDILGRKCIECGYDKDVRALEIDHINSDGWEDRKNKKKSGGSYYHFIKNNIASGNNSYQVLCSNCNTIKRIEMQECPRLEEGEENHGTERY